MTVLETKYICTDKNISIITRMGHKNKTIIIKAKIEGIKIEKDVRLGGLAGHPDIYCEIIWDFDKKITKLNYGKQIKKGDLRKSKITTDQVLDTIRKSTIKMAKKYGLQPAQYK